MVCMLQLASAKSQTAFDRDSPLEQFGQYVIEKREDGRAWESSDHGGRVIRDCLCVEQHRWHRFGFPELALIDRTSAAFGDLSDAFVEDVSQISASDSFTLLRPNKIMGQFSNAATLSDFQPSLP
jgi:hypothetical protein